VKIVFAGVFAGHVADRVRTRLRIPCEVTLADDTKLGLEWALRSGKFTISNTQNTVGTSSVSATPSLPSQGIIPGRGSLGGGLVPVGFNVLTFAANEFISALNAMLQNERYSGRLYWNRSTWVKDPDSGKRVRRERPKVNGPSPSAPRSSPRTLGLGSKYVCRREQPEPLVSKQGLRLQVSQQIPVQYTPMRLAGKHPVRTHAIPVAGHRLV